MQCSLDGGGGRWPTLSSPCGAHGTCTPLGSSYSYCACESGWSSSGDFVFTPFQQCHVRQIVLLVQWSVSLLILLLAALTFVKVVSAYLEILREQQRRKGQGHAQEQTRLSTHADDHHKTRVVKRHSQLHRFKRWIAATFAFIFQNHTRRCLFGAGVMLVAYATLCALKIASIALQLHDSDGPEYLHERTGQLIGYDFWPTLLYCIASMAFLITGHFSSLLWCASAQSFYSRSEGAALTHSTKRELWMAVVLDTMCYLLPGVCCFLAHAVDDGFYLKAHPSMAYEMTLALHFQLKGIVPVVMWLTDQRIARRVVANLNAHQATQERLRLNKLEVQNQVAAATAAAIAERNGQHSMIVRTSVGGPSDKRKPVLDTSLNGHASDDHQLISPMSAAGVTLAQPQSPQNRRASATDTTAPFGVPVAADDGAGVGGAGDSARGRGRHGSVDSLAAVGKHSRVHSKDLDGLETVPAAPDSPRDANAVTILRPKAKYASLSSQEDEGGGAAATTTAEAPDASAVDVSGRAPLLNANRAARRSSNPRRASHSSELIAAPPKKLFAPAVTAADNGPPLSAMQMRLNSMTVVADQNTTVVEMQPFNQPDDAAGDTASQLKPGSRRVGQSSMSMMDGSGAALFVGFKPRASMGSSAAQPTQPPLMLPRTGSPSPSVLHSASGAGHATTAHAATTTTHAAPSHTLAPRQTQAEIAAESRKKISDFTSALSKHNRAASFTSMTWLIGNTLFGWIPLLRSFVPFLLPVQVLFSLLAMRTFLATLTPRSSGAQTQPQPSLDPKTKAVVSGKTSTGPAGGLAAAFSLPLPATHIDDSKLLIDSSVHAEQSQQRQQPLQQPGVQSDGSHHV